MSHALGALDGKHIPIRCPRRGSSHYHNYKGFHSIVLLALVDADYKFLWVDLGIARSSSDAQIFKHSDLRYKIEDGTIGFPENESLVDDGPKVHYFILGDNAFLLKLWLMMPYSRRGMDLNQTMFNYRLSRAKKGGRERFRDTNVPLPDIPEANAESVYWPKPRQVALIYAFVHDKVSFRKFPSVV